MTAIHPRERKIAKLVMNSHVYKKLKQHCNNHPIFNKIENTVLFGLHAFELILILAAGVITTTFAFNLPALQTITSSFTGSTTFTIQQTPRADASINEVSLPPKK